MATKTHKYLGTGLYTIAEAALYCRVSTSMMTRWIFGTKAGRSVISPEFESKERFVTFLDLVQTLAIREIKEQADVPLIKFRQAIEFAKKNYCLDHIFARNHFTYLYDEELIIKPSADTNEYVDASGKNRGQGRLQFVEMYMRDLNYSPDGLAHKYEIFKSAHGISPVIITLDPHVRFGEPLLPSGYTALTIRNAIKTEGSIENTAEAYGISIDEVEAAYRFGDYLSKRAA